MLPKWAWSGSREQFLHCGLRKFRHSKSSVYRWYTQLDHRRFAYDTWDNGSRLGRVMVECTLFMTHCLRLNLQLHTISLVRTCTISSFCTVAWQLARLLLTRRIARSLGDSWASCNDLDAAGQWSSGVRRGRGDGRWPLHFPGRAPTVPSPGRFGAPLPAMSMVRRRRWGPVIGRERRRVRPVTPPSRPRRPSNSDHAGTISTYSGKIDYRFLTFQTGSRF